MRLFRAGLNRVLAPLLGRVPLDRLLDVDNHIRLAYRLVLHRAPDAEGFRHFKQHIEAQQLPRAFVFEALTSSPEYKKAQNPLAYVRTVLVQRLPHADVIVDFGGSSREMEEGGLYAMGYKQKWQRLLIVDLPPDAQDAQWRPRAGQRRTVQTPNGPVEHVYGSMSDRALLGEKGFADLVWSGNAIEHIAEAEADEFIENVREVLKPGGVFCLDTPNRAVTRLQCPEGLTNPDHKLEYTHAQLRAKLEAHGFAVEEQLGVLDCAEAVESGRFLAERLPVYPDFTDRIENGYFLFYRCRKPKP
jgi:SAM-dependent methyltransferase